MTIFLGADHGGFQIKELLKTWLEQEGHQVEDLGAMQLLATDDYPEIAFKVATSVSSNPQSFGLLICRSGGGMAVAANKVKGIRAIEVFNRLSARHAREHNDANIATISADWLSISEIKEIINTFLETAFSNAERHQRRLAQISQYEQENL